MPNGKGVVAFVCSRLLASTHFLGIRPSDTFHFRHVGAPAVSLHTFTLAHMTMVESVKVRTATMIYLVILYVLCGFRG